MLGTALYVGGAFVLVRALVGAPFAPILALIPYAAVVGALLVRWQHSAYTRWVDTYGAPTAATQRFGLGTVAVQVGDELRASGVEVVEILLENR